MVRRHIGVKFLVVELLDAEAVDTAVDVDAVDIDEDVVGSAGRESTGLFGEFVEARGSGAGAAAAAAAAAKAAAAASSARRASSSVSGGPTPAARSTCAPHRDSTEELFVGLVLPVPSGKRGGDTRLFCEDDDVVVALEVELFPKAYEDVLDVNTPALDFVGLLLRLGTTVDAPCTGRLGILNAVPEPVADAPVFVSDTAFGSFSSAGAGFGKGRFVGDEGACVEVAAGRFVCRDGRLCSC